MVPTTVYLEATDLIQLIDWEKETITEPIFTSKLTLAQLEDIEKTPLDIPFHSLHTQSCERAVKLVTKASESVCGWAKRDGFVRAQMKHRDLMPVLKSKKDFMHVYSKP